MSAARSVWKLRSAICRSVGYDKIQKTEQELLNYALDGLAKIPHVTVYGGTENRENRCGVISFNVDGVHPHDVASILDADGVAIRAGHHCAQPLMEYLKRQRDVPRKPVFLQHKRGH